VKRGAKELERASRKNTHHERIADDDRERVDHEVVDELRVS
jgi:hypothetical protein